MRHSKPSRLFSALIATMTMSWASLMFMTSSRLVHSPWTRSLSVERSSHQLRTQKLTLFSASSAWTTSKTYLSYSYKLARHGKRLGSLSQRDPNAASRRHCKSFACAAPQTSPYRSFLRYVKYTSWYRLITTSTIQKRLDQTTCLPCHNAASQDVKVMSARINGERSWLMRVKRPKESCNTRPSSKCYQ